MKKVDHIKRALMRKMDMLALHIILPTVHFDRCNPS